MKIPLRWLADYVETTLTVSQLAERLTLAGLEVAGFRFLGLPVPSEIFVKDEEKGPVWLRDTVKVAEVLKVERHPNADKLKLVTLNYGAEHPKMVVTGAPNIQVGEVGTKVILGLRGTLYFDGHATPKQIKEIKPGNLRGVESDAMVMSNFELGIADDHDGIILLESDAPIGTPLADFMGDVVLEVDVLPNMARCLGMIGVAREVAAIAGSSLKMPATDVARSAERAADLVRVSIDDPKLSARYQATVIRNVTMAPSPGWMQRRLTYAGLRPISNIVDVTNYVMLECGQPLHAFDYDVLVRRAGKDLPHITVRNARAGEKLVTLDKVERELTPEMLVIADAVGPIALAGVMGGQETEVSATTKNVLLEAANFDFISIRKTARALNLPSEASLRFSRGLHPETVNFATERALHLMAKTTGGTVCAGSVDCYPAPPKPRVIDLPMSEVQRILGMDFPIAEAKRILTALEFHVDQRGESLHVTAPPNRLDIQDGPADLIEDLARLYGYDRLPARLLAAQLPAQLGNRTLVLEEQARDLMVESGLTEAITYALTTPKKESPLLGAGPSTPESAANYLTLINPINEERTAMRRTVLAGLLDVTAENLKHASTVKVFEIGRVYLPQAGQRFPQEPTRIALALVGRRTAAFWEDGTATPPPLGFFDLKGIVESLVSGLHLPNVSYRKAAVTWLHPGQSAEVLIAGKPAGVFGRLHPRTAPAYDLADKTVFVAELDLDALLAAVPERFPYVPVSRFPVAKRDIALIVPEEISAERVVAEIREGGGALLRNVTLFDLYRGESIAKGTKSLAFALTYQGTATLSDKDVDKAHRKVEERVTRALGAQVRGK